MPIKCFHAHDVLLRCEFDVLPTFLSILAYLGIGPFRLGSLSLFEYFIRYDRLVVVFNQIRILPASGNGEAAIFLVRQDHIDGALAPDVLPGG